MDQERRGLHNVLSFLIFFHKLKVLDDLEYGFDQVCDLIFLILLDGRYQSWIVDSNIHQHDSLEVYLCALLSVGRILC